MALYRHVVQGSYPGEIWTFGIHTEGTASLAAAQTAWMDGLTAFFSAAYLATLCTDVEVTSAYTVELDVTTGSQLSKIEDPRTEAGTSTATCLPFQCTPVVSLRTAFATRSGRGRFYAPSPAVDQVAVGRLAAASQTTLADSALAMFQTLQGAALDPVILSRATMVRTPITSLDVGDVIDTQRRRRNKLIEARTSRQL